MKNFYKHGRGLPKLRFFFTKKTDQILLLNNTEMNETAQSALSSENEDNYEGYLASLIYEYQLKLKYANEKSVVINKNTRHSDIINNKTSDTFLSFISSSFSNYQNITVVFILFLFSCMAGNPLYAQEYSSGHKSVSYIPKEKELNYIKSLSDVDLLARYPLFNYLVDSTLIKPIKIGDIIPDELMQLPLWVVGQKTLSDTIRLADYPRDKLLVIDFWANWCSPCVASMEKWESYVDTLGGQIQLLGVNIDFDYKAFPFIRKRGWKSLSVIGLNAFVLNRYFFDRPVVSRMAWIKDGRLIAITGTKGYDLDLVRKVVSGHEVSIPNNYQWTYITNED